MSKPKNGAARNSMTKMERQCYDWGWDDAQAEVIKYLESRIEDFKACTKNDCCPEHIYVLEGIIEDLKDDICPSCGTAAIYELEKNNFACECTYKLETGE